MRFCFVYILVITTTTTMQHVCTDSCFKNRTAKKSMVPCFACLKNSNLNCFSITDNTVLKTISSSLNVIFVCAKCSDKMIKNRQSASRRLSDSSVKRSAPSIDRTAETNDAGISFSSVSSQNVLLTNFFETITDKLNKIEKETSNIRNDIHNKYVQPDNTTNTNKSNETISDEKHTIDNIYKILLKTSDNITKLHTTENEKESLQRLTNLFDKNLGGSSSTPAPKKQHNLFDWSLHDSHINIASDENNGRQLLVVKQSIDDDVLKILKHSDETTWFTLDLIIKKLNENGEKIDSLLHSNEAVNCVADERTNVVASSNSPLIDAIRETSDDSLMPGTFNYSEDLRDVLNVDPEVDTVSQKENAALNALNSLDTIDSTQTSSPNQNQSESINTPSDNSVINITDNDSRSEKSTRLHEFHVTRFNNKTTLEMVKNLLLSKGIEESDVKISFLVPRDRDPSTLNFVSFKIDASDKIATTIMKPNFWPEHCIIKPFVQRPKKTADLTSMQTNNQSTHNQHFFARRPPVATIR